LNVDRIKQKDIVASDGTPDEGCVNR